MSKTAGANGLRRFGGRLRSCLHRKALGKAPERFNGHRDGCPVPHERQRTFDVRATVSRRCPEAGVQPAHDQATQPLLSAGRQGPGGRRDREGGRLPSSRRDPMPSFSPAECHARARRPHQAPVTSYGTVGRPKPSGARPAPASQRDGSGRYLTSGWIRLIPWRCASGRQ